MPQELRSRGALAAAVILIVTYVASFSVIGLGLYQLQLVRESASKFIVYSTVTLHPMEMPELIVMGAFLGVVPTLAAIAVSWYWIKAQPMWVWLAAEVVVAAIAAWISLDEEGTYLIWGLLGVPFVLPLLLAVGTVFAGRHRAGPAKAT